MVVGLGSYKDKTEAYPLDNKTLNSIALRSILTPFSNNLESASSIGWLYAIEPGLRKIHDKNEEDLALAMGHNLEYTRGLTSFSPFAMGVILALEAQKLDLETIRGVRSAITSLCEGLGLAYYSLLLILGMTFIPSLMPFGLIALGIAVIIDILIRFISIKVGYANATRIAEKINKKPEGFNKAARNAGLIMIGSLVIVSAIVLSNAIINPINGMELNINYINSIISIFFIYLLYNLLTKKNYSMGKCVLLIIIISIILGLAVSFI